jgi:hypothetical protein
MQNRGRGVGGRRSHFSPRRFERSTLRIQPGGPGRGAGRRRRAGRRSGQARRCLPSPSTDALRPPMPVLPLSSDAHRATRRGFGWPPGSSDAYSELFNSAHGVIGAEKAAGLRGLRPALQVTPQLCPRGAHTSNSVFSVPLWRVQPLCALSDGHGKSRRATRTAPCATGGLPRNSTAGAPTVSGRRPLACHPPGPPRRRCYSRSKTPSAAHRSRRNSCRRWAPS